jgi:hypothetical protein
MKRRVNVNRSSALGVFAFLTLAVAIWSVAASLSAVRAASGGSSPRTEGNAALRPHARNVVVVVMENRDYASIIASPQAPYINGTLVPEAALMTAAHAVTHPSQPNYVALFSGSTQGVWSDSCPHAFSSANAGAELLTARKTFAGYSESMPADGYTGCWSGTYARKHNPWVDFTTIPASSNLVYRRFPVPPPTLAIVVPNVCHDMHSCSTRTGDDWLKANLPPILAYDATHDGLLILTWDEAEPDRDGTNHIATLLVGPTVKPGTYGQPITHYSVLNTIETIAGIPCTGAACAAPLLEGMWR